MELMDHINVFAHKVWDTESSLNINKIDDSTPIPSHSASYVSGCTESSGDNITTKTEVSPVSRSVV